MVAAPPPNLQGRPAECGEAPNDWIGLGPFSSRVAVAAQPLAPATFFFSFQGTRHETPHHLHAGACIALTCQPGTSSRRAGLAGYLLCESRSCCMKAAAAAGVRALFFFFGGRLLCLGRRSWEI